jgi:hypothetical protein
VRPPRLFHDGGRTAGEEGQVALSQRGQKLGKGKEPTRRYAESRSMEPTSEDPDGDLTKLGIVMDEGRPCNTEHLARKMFPPRFGFVELAKVLRRS